MAKFDGQVALITGASSGIGAALARAFAHEGAHTILMARRADRIDDLARELTDGKRRSIAVAGDVTRDGDLERAVERARTEFGRLDIAVANAGFSVAGRLADLTLDDYRRQLETNVFGVLRTLYAALPELRKTKGRIVLLGSLAGAISLPGGTAYSMSKFALAGLADGLSHELAADGVSVTHIMAGFVNTEIYQIDKEGVLRQDPNARWPPKRITMPPDRAARQIVSAAYRRKRLQIVTGHAKASIFFQRLVPGIVYFTISRAVRKIGYARQS
ncbi:MAG: SDR family NAD(P)-dependent oxidoreductase [Bryobacteraceae bacterium]|jgi:short-subunit dehydrogenase